jgi:F-type H+-transporting ATPase subunit delta
MNGKTSRRIIVRATAQQLLAHPSRQAHIMKELAAYLLEQKMVNDVDLVINDLIRELADVSGTMLVSVTSAYALSDTVRKELTQSLQTATGATDVILSETIDTDLLGGLIARTPDAELDLSVRTKLKRLSAIK